MTQESVDLDAIELPPAAGRKRPSGNGAYRPHDFHSVEEVPPLADFGDGIITQYTTSTHDKDGYLTTDPGLIQEMIDHYTAKIEAATDDIALFRHDPREDAETLVISYGVTSRSAAMAVREARDRGKRISSLTLQTLYPVPERAIKSAIDGVARIVVPEMNMGQYRLEIERLAPDGAEVIGVNKMNTTLISPDEIIAEGGLL